MKEGGIATIVVGTDLESSEKAVSLSEKYENIFACIGQHPADNDVKIFDSEKYEKLIQKGGWSIPA